MNIDVHTLTVTYSQPALISCGYVQQSPAENQASLAEVHSHARLWYERTDLAGSLTACLFSTITTVCSLLGPLTFLSHGPLTSFTILDIDSLCSTGLRSKQKVVGHPFINSHVTNSYSVYILPLRVWCWVGLLMATLPLVVCIASSKLFIKWNFLEKGVWIGGSLNG